MWYDIILHYMQCYTYFGHNYTQLFRYSYIHLKGNKAFNDHFHEMTCCVRVVVYWLERTISLVHSESIYEATFPRNVYQTHKKKANDDCNVLQESVYVFNVEFFYNDTKSFSICFFPFFWWKNFFYFIWGW